MDSNKDKRIRSFLTPLNSVSLNSISGIRGSTICNRLLCPVFYTHLFFGIYHINSLIASFPRIEYESNEESKSVKVKVEQQIVCTKHSVNDFDDWIFIKDKNSYYSVL
jgi:hypothetical protein